MNKLLISLLSLTGIAGISTGSYFLLKNSKDDKKATVVQESSEETGAGTPAIAKPEVSSTGQSQQSLPLPQPSSSEETKST